MKVGCRAVLIFWFAHFCFLTSLPPSLPPSLHLFGVSYNFKINLSIVYLLSIHTALPPSLPPFLPPSLRRPGVLHLLERNLIKLDIHHSNINGGNGEKQGEGGKEKGGGSPVRPSASPVERLLFGYDVRGGLYFDRNGTGEREEAEGGEGLGERREEAGHQVLPTTSSSSLGHDGERGRAEASALS